MEQARRANGRAASTPDTRGPEQAPGATQLDIVAAQPMEPLWRLRITYRVIGWWTLWYAATSWILEWLFAQFDSRTAEPFIFGLNRVVYAFYWGIAGWIAVVATDRWPITRAQQSGRIILHFVLCFVVVFAWVTASYYTNLAIVPGWEPHGLGLMLATVSKNVLFGYGVLVVLVHIVWWVRRHRAHEVSLLQQAKRATESQLQVLKMELQPHFLFNALHSVSALIDQDPRAANETLVRISDMLHHAVRTARVQVVPLRDELRTLRLYTDIEQLRFEDRLQLTWDVPETLLDIEVPHMLLQPLVENAIKHAVEPQSTPGHVELRVREVRGPDGEPAIEICLSDDGPGPRARTARPGAGVGLKNTQERLLELYATRQSFDIEPGPKGGTVVRIVLPYRATFPGYSPTHSSEPVLLPSYESGRLRAAQGGSAPGRSADPQVVR